MRIAALVACHNRKAHTLACIDALFLNPLPEGHALDVVLVDDGSTDGTGSEVRTRYPHVHIIKGDGNLYWNGGMRVAFLAALQCDYNYYLWLNDDTLLYPTAIRTLLTTAEDIQARLGKPAIVVGSTQDAIDGRQTYGGVKRPHRWKPTTFALIGPCSTPVECETMNGNCVLIPCEVAHAVGNLEPRYAHAMGDLDYGLRARHAGFKIWLMPGFAGTCSNNPADDLHGNASLPASVRLRKMMQPTRLPPASWRVFTRRHGGIFWPLFWVWPYAKVVMSALIKTKK